MRENNFTSPKMSNQVIIPSHNNKLNTQSNISLMTPQTAGYNKKHSHDLFLELPTPTDETHRKDVDPNIQL